MVYLTEMKPESDFNKLLDLGSLQLDWFAVGLKPINHSEQFIWFLMIITLTTLIGFSIIMIFYNKIYPQQINPNMVSN